MKLYVVLPFFLTSIFVFSQNENKEMHNLFDSIQAIDPYEKLYSKINTQKATIENRENQIEIVNNNTTKLKEYFFRQELYRAVFDQLESGIMPEALQVENYYNSAKTAGWIDYDRKFFDIPKSNNTFFLIIFVNPYSDSQLRDSSIFKGYPFTDFVLAFYNEDPILIKQYPKVAAMIKEGKIVFSVESFIPKTLSAMQVSMLEFPSQLFTNANKSVASKNKLASDLLSFISNQVRLAIRDYSNKSDIVTSYLKLEKEKLANTSIDKKIDLRIKFIEFLKIKYPEIWK